MRWLVCLALCAGCAEGTPTPLEGEQPFAFGFPLADPALVADLVIGVDHDPEVFGTDPVSSAQCVDYLGRGFPHCYDEHHGSDFMLVGGFPTMDTGSLEILAAAAGTVVEVVQDNYDRCHVSGEGIDCDGHPVRANYIILEHNNGLQSWYYHLMQGSSVVEVGQEVSCGETLALVGSSGLSSAPHLHFQVVEEEQVLDPFVDEGAAEVSLWFDQGSPEELPAAGCTSR